MSVVVISKDEYRNALLTLPDCQIVMVGYMFALLESVPGDEQDKRLTTINSIPKAKLIPTLVDFLIKWTPSNDLYRHFEFVEIVKTIKPRLFEDVAVIRHPCEMCSVIMYTHEGYIPACLETISVYKKWYEC
jgi:hypothetical protein